MQASWDFMHHHGNTSGSSNIAILHHELTRDQEKPREYIMCLAGGPGELPTFLSLEHICFQSMAPWQEKVTLLSIFLCMALLDTKDQQFQITSASLAPFCCPCCKTAPHPGPLASFCHLQAFLRAVLQDAVTRVRSDQPRILPLLEGLSTLLQCSMHGLC